MHIWFRYQPPYRISGTIEGTTLKITECTHASYNDPSCPLIDTGGISPWFNCTNKSGFIGPHGRSGKAIRGFPGHLTDSRRQLPEIDIEIRFIAQVYSSALPYSACAIG